MKSVHGSYDQWVNYTPIIPLLIKGIWLTFPQYVIAAINIRINFPTACSSEKSPLDSPAKIIIMPAYFLPVKETAFACVALFRAIMRNHSFVFTHRQQVSSCAVRGCRVSHPSIISRGESRGVPPECSVR